MLTYANYEFVIEEVLSNPILDWVHNVMDIHPMSFEEDMVSLVSVMKYLLDGGSVVHHRHK